MKILTVCLLKILIRFWKVNLTIKLWDRFIGIILDLLFISWCLITPLLISSIFHCWRTYHDIWWKGALSMSVKLIIIINWNSNWAPFTFWIYSDVVPCTVYLSSFIFVYLSLRIIYKTLLWVWTLYQIWCSLKLWVKLILFLPTIFDFITYLK